MWWRYGAPKRTLAKKKIMSCARDNIWCVQDNITCSPETTWCTEKTMCMFTRFLLLTGDQTDSAILHRNERVSWAVFGLWMNRHSQILLVNRHHYIVSERHLEWTLKSCNLFWRKRYNCLNHKSLNDIVGGISLTSKEKNDLLLLPSSHRDYQTMWFLMGTIVPCTPDNFLCVPDSFSCANFFSPMFL